MITPIPWQRFKRLIRFCVQESNYVGWNGKFYKQVDGLTIGGCVSGILADFVITDILNDAIYESGMDPTLTCKYVDDILMIIQEDEIENMFTLLNSINTSVKFTCEMEMDQQIAYLDMKIQRDMNHTISTCYYQKPTCKNRLLNFHSAHPITQKSGVAFGTISRVLTLSSSKYRTDNIKTIYDILGMNGYPKQLIGNLINKFDNKRKDLCMDIYTNRIAKKYRGMIHIPELTESFDKLFKKYDPDIQIGYKPWKTIGKITKNKNINNKDDDNTHAVVYSFECNDCDGIYILVKQDRD